MKQVFQKLSPYKTVASVTRAFTSMLDDLAAIQKREEEEEQRWSAIRSEAVAEEIAARNRAKEAAALSARISKLVHGPA